MRRPWWLWVVGALILEAVPLSCRLVHAEEPEAIEAILRKRVEEDKQTFSIVVGLVDASGSKVYAYGNLGADRPQAVDGKTLFEIGSLSKAYTAVLLQDAVQRGLVGLEDPVSKYLPATVKMPTKDGKAITLRQLATHTSGLPRLPDNLEAKDTVNPYAAYTVQQMYDFLSGYTLPRDPGQQYEYSNLGAGLLGHVLALQAGKTYEELVQERIAGPLGMKDTKIQLSDADRTRLAQGHDAAGQPASNWDLPTLAGAGALRSTVDDQLLFLSANLGLTQTPLNDVLQKTHAKLAETGEPTMPIALGWHRIHQHGSEIVFHNGQTGGYHTFLGFDPAKKVGVVVLSASANDIDDIGRHLLNPDFKLAFQRRFAVAVDTDLYDQFVGHYQLAPGFVLSILKEGTLLYVQATGQGKTEIQPESPTKFFSVDVDAQITFVKDDQGQVTHLILHQGGRDTKAPRLGDDYKPPARTEIQVEPALLADYTGQYQLAPGVVLTVTAEGAQLKAQLTGQPAFPVFAEAKDRFFFKVVEAVLTFQRDAEGKVDAVVLLQGGFEQKAPRLASESGK